MYFCRNQTTSYFRHTNSLRHSALIRYTDWQVRKIYFTLTS